jgi:adenylate cyclase
MIMIIIRILILFENSNSGSDTMSEERALRRLSAIFSADVKGYSRLMQDDESSTVRILKAYRELMSSFIQEYRGRVVDSPGDNVLAEFASVVDAVESAVEIQKELKEKNEELPEDRRMEFRIGINLGDVIAEGERIYGDGINIAARIEGLAEGGGICISGTAYDQIGRKLPLGYEFLGEQTVKNIEKPIRVYRVLMKPEVAGMVIGEGKAQPRVWKRGILAVAVVLVLGGIAATIWNLYLRPAPPSEEIASKPKMAIPMSEQPSIAVLPFKNLSGDQEQEYFSDGITNDIITDLSKFSELLVIASNSVFVYKGKPVKAQKVNQELGARYILEGSVQRASEKVRVNAQLIDATSGHHIWAERYDRDLKDLFAVQDEIVQTIVATLAVKIDAEERARVMRKDTESLEAYDYVLRGWEYYSRSTRSANIQARQMFEKAIELDPGYATAYVGLGQTHLAAAAYGWTEFSNQALQRTHYLAQKALSLDETSASAHALLGAGYRFRMQYNLAVQEYERAIELNPNDAYSHAERGAIMNYSGQTDKAIQALETALRFNPHMLPGDYMQLGLAYYLKGRYDDSIGTLERGLSWYPDNVYIHIPLAAAYAQAGRLIDAARIAATVRRLHPFFEVNNYGTAFIDPDDRARIADGLREAGL